MVLHHPAVPYDVFGLDLASSTFRKICSIRLSRFPSSARERRSVSHASTKRPIGTIDEIILVIIWLPKLRVFLLVINMIAYHCYDPQSMIQIHCIRLYHEPSNAKSESMFPEGAQIFILVSPILQLHQPFQRFPKGFPGTSSLLQGRRSPDLPDSGPLKRPKLEWCEALPGLVN